MKNQVVIRPHLRYYIRHKIIYYGMAFTLGAMIGETIGEFCRNEMVDISYWLLRLSAYLCGSWTGAIFASMIAYDHYRIVCDADSGMITGPGFWWGRESIEAKNIINKEYQQRTRIKKLFFRYKLETADGKAIYVDENIYENDVVPGLLSLGG